VPIVDCKEQSARAVAAPKYRATTLSR
jgi:hypothetical protein